MSETCQRCQSVGEDRRTLWMACFYAMHELSVPFEQASVHGVVCAKTGEEELPMLKMTVPAWAEPKGESRHHSFYTLRVCKRCRGEWMAAIERWFHEPPEGQDRDADEREPSAVGSGIFIRERGVTKEVSREEWDRRNPGRKPVVYRPKEG